MATTRPHHPAEPPYNSSDNLRRGHYEGGLVALVACGAKWGTPAGYDIIVVPNSRDLKVTVFRIPGGWTARALADGHAAFTAELARRTAAQVAA